MKKALLFDFDGVICDSFNIVFSIMKAAKPELTRTSYRACFDGNINEAYTGDSVASQPKEPKKREAFVEHFIAEYDKGILQTAPFPGMKDLILSLAEQYMLIIISSTNSASIDLYLERHGIDDCFRHVYGYEISPSKVVKINMAFDAYDLASTDCLFITDTLGDAREAEQCKVKALGVNWGYQSRESLMRSENTIGVAEYVTDLPVLIDDFFAV